MKTKASDGLKKMRANLEETGELEPEMRLRFASLIEEAENAEKRADEAAKNSGFKQVYQKGWRTIAGLCSTRPGAAKVYSVIASLIDERFGAIIASQDALAERCEMSVRTIRDHLNFLDQEGHIVRFRAGGAMAYCVDPAAVWCGRDDTKDKAAFHVGAIASQNEWAAFKVKCLGTVGKKGRPRKTAPPAALVNQAEPSAEEAA